MKNEKINSTSWGCVYGRRTRAASVIPVGEGQVGLQRLSPLSTGIPPGKALWDKFHLADDPGTKFS